MTQEEKARAYDEALERAKEFHDGPTATVVTRTFFEQVFPQLRESEDEKIRKFLIEEFTRRKEGWCLPSISVCDIIAWLEKQEEKKLTEWSYPYGKNETVDRLVSIAECLEMDGDCVYNRYKGDECGVFLRALAREYLCIEELVNVVQDKNLMDILYYASSDCHFPSLRKLHTLLTSYNEQKEQKEQKSEPFDVNFDYEENVDLAGNAIGFINVGAGYLNNRCRTEVIRWLKSVPETIKKLMKTIEQLKKQKAQKPIDEDKRIRNAIFKALSKKDARDVLLAEGIQVSDALTYLEKHK